MSHMSHISHLHCTAPLQHLHCTTSALHYTAHTPALPCTHTCTAPLQHLHCTHTHCPASAPALHTHTLPCFSTCTAPLHHLQKRYIVTMSSGTCLDFKKICQTSNMNYRGSKILTFLTDQEMTKNPNNKAK